MNHTILGKFRAPKNMSVEGFQLFSCLITRIQNDHSLKYKKYEDASCSRHSNYFNALKMNGRGKSIRSKSARQGTCYLKDKDETAIIEDVEEPKKESQVSSICVNYKYPFLDCKSI